MVRVCRMAPYRVCPLERSSPQRGSVKAERSAAGTNEGETERSVVEAEGTTLIRVTMEGTANSLVGLQRRLQLRSPGERRTKGAAHHLNSIERAPVILI